MDVIIINETNLWEVKIKHKKINSSKFLIVIMNCCYSGGFIKKVDCNLFI